MNLPPLTGRAFGLNLLTVVLWGANPVATSFSADSMPPLAIAGWRFVLATLFMWWWCNRSASRQRLRLSHWPWILVAGVLLFVQIWTFTLGVSWTSASHAALFVNTYVIWVVLAEFGWLGESRFSQLKGVGLVLATVGAGLLLLATPAVAKVAAEVRGPTFAGDLMMIFSGFLFAVKFLFTKAAVRRVDSNQLMLWHDVVAVVLFGLSSYSMETITWSRVSWVAWLGILYQGVAVGGICFALQAYLLRSYSPTSIAIFSFATPLVGIACGWGLRGDEVSVWLLASCGLIATGIYLVNREG